MRTNLALIRIQLLQKCKWFNQQLWIDFMNLFSTDFNWLSSNKRKVLKSNGSSVVRLNPGIEDLTKCTTANIGDDNFATKISTTHSINFNCGVFEWNASITRDTDTDTSIACTSSLDYKSENEVDEVNVEHIKKRKEDTSAKKQKSVSNKAVHKQRSKRVNCCQSRILNCKETFDNWQAMMYHVTTYHAKRIKRTFECHLCGKSFTSKRCIQQHVASVHTGLRPFKCPNRFCLKSFPQKGHLKQHIDSIHLGLKPFKCPNRLCSKSFSRKSILEAHIESLHTWESCPNIKENRLRCISSGAPYRYFRELIMISDQTDSAVRNPSFYEIPSDTLMFRIINKTFK